LLTVSVSRVCGLMSESLQFSVNVAINAYDPGAKWTVGKMASSATASTLFDKLIAEAPYPSQPSRSMAAASSWPCSNRHAATNTSTSSSCHPNSPSWTPAKTG